VTIECWILSVIPVLGLFLLAGFARVQLRNWLAPSAFFALYWALALSAPLVLAPDFYFWPGAAWLILFIAMCVHVGAQLGWAAGAVNVETLDYDPRTTRYQLRWGKAVLIGCSLLGLLGVAVTLQSRGYALSVLLHPKLIPGIAREFARARYFESVGQPFAISVFTTFSWLGAIVGGVWLATDVSGRTRWWALLPLVPVGLDSMINTSRLGLLLVASFLSAACLATLVLKQATFRFCSVRLLCIVVLLLLIAVGVYFGLQMLRYGPKVDTSIALDKTRASLLGTPSVFSQWLEREGLENDDPTWGAYNLAGMMDLLGLATREQGLYPESLSLGKGKGSSNIYTWFRGWIQDFTLLGALVGLWGVGVAAGFAYRRVATGRVSWLPLLALYYACVLVSYLINILVYNTIVFAWLFFFLLLSPFGLRLLRRIPANRLSQVH
jgi:oligosaccharide repeat unit polymerase